MLRQIALFAVIALAGTSLATRASAQDDERGRHQATLSERLERFRRDLLGDGASAKTQDIPADVTRRVTRKPRTTTSTPPSTSSKSKTVGRLPAPDAAPRLEPQNARRAQNGTGTSPLIVGGSDIAKGGSIKQGPKKRPVIIRGDVAESRANVETQPEATDDAQQVEPSREEPRMAAAPTAPEPSIEVSPNVEDPLPIEEIVTAQSPSEPSLQRADAAAEAPQVRVEDPSTPPFGLKNKAAASSGVLFTTQSPVLSVEATGPRKVLIGKEASFVVKIQNTGAAANNIVVTVNIPSYVEVISAEASAGAAQSPAANEHREPLEWKISRLEANGRETLNLKLVPRKNTPLDLAVQWTFTPEASQTMVEVQEPKLTMSISGPDEVLYGQSKIYKLTVSNPGNGDTENVTVGLLPIGRATEAAPSHRLGTLRAGETKTVDIELTARQAGAITIKAQAFADGGLRADAAEQVLVRRASLRIEVAAPKVKYAGTVGTYRVKVINAGNATGENVQISASLPPEAKYVSSNGGRLETQLSKVNWTIGTLQPGAERLLEMQCALSAPGENRTQFVAIADGDLSAAATSLTQVEALADLKLEIRDPQGPIAVGEDTVYEVHIRNRGTKLAESIELAVFFSQGLEATSVEGGPHDIAAGQVVFKPLTTLAAGDTAVYRVHARAETSGNHVFRAELVCQSPQMKLAAEEATHFYGEDSPVPAEVSHEGEPYAAGRTD